jgi:hypothetical protein
MKIIITERQYGLFSKLLNEQSNYQLVLDVYNSIVDAVEGLGTNTDGVFNALSKIKSASDFIYLKSFFKDGKTGYKSFDEMIDGEYDSLNYSEVYRITRLLKRLGVNVTYNHKKDLLGNLYFNKGFKSTVSMASETLGCRTKVQSLMNQAKDWWLKWLSDPITKQKFKKNWNVGPNGILKGTKVDDIFKNYIEIINKTTADYYSSYSPVTFVNKFDISKIPGLSDNLMAFVHPAKFGRDKMIINCSNIEGQDVLATIIHEIQHLLFDYFPLNPENKIQQIYSSKNTTLYDPFKRFDQVVNISSSGVSEDPDKMEGINMENLKIVSKKYNILEETLMNWYKTALIETRQGFQANYVCNETEKMSNIISLRKNLNLTPSKNFSYKDFLPFINKQKEDVDAKWLILCWSLNGFPDIEGWISRINQLAVQKSKSAPNNYVTDRNLA